MDKATVTLLYILSLNFDPKLQEAYRDFAELLNKIYEASPNLQTKLGIPVALLESWKGILRGPPSSMTRRSIRYELALTVYDSDCQETRPFFSVVQMHENFRASCSPPAPSSGTSRLPEKGCVSALHARRPGQCTLTAAAGGGGSVDVSPQCCSRRPVPVRECLRSGEGFVTTVWGPMMWYFLECVALHANYAKVPAKTLQSFFRSAGGVLPCVHCRDNFPENSRRAGIDDAEKSFGNRERAAHFVFWLHKEVSRALGKTEHEGYTYQQMLDRHNSGRCVRVSIDPREN